MKRRGWRWIRRLGKEQLNALMLRRSSEPDIDLVVERRVEKLLAEQFGVPFRCYERQEIGRSAIRGRVYTRYELSPETPDHGKPHPGAESHSIFVKRGRSVVNPELEWFLNGQTSRWFAAPRFFGSFSVDRGEEVAVWEHVRGCFALFGPRLSPSTRRAIQAVAAINATPCDAVSTLALPTGTPWVVPAAEQVEATARRILPKTHPAADRMLLQAEQLARFEPALISRFQALGDRFLTHNDIKAENIILRDGDGALVVTDWKSTRVNAAGVGLRLIADGGPQKQRAIAAFYVACMARRGYRVRLDEVLFAIRATRAFKMLQEGLKQGEIGRLEAGLNRSELLIRTALGRGTIRAGPEA